MKDYCISFSNLTYYLVSLFYKTECKYSCTLTKISKILSILAFKYAYREILLFKEEIKKYENCGTIIFETNFLVYGDEYICYKDQNNKEYITDELKDPINLPARLDDRYKYICEHCDLPKYIKQEVDEVFRCFGAYSQIDLSEVLNPIVEKVTKENYGKIDLSKISAIVNEVAQDNEVIKYIKSNHISNEVNNDKPIRKKIRKIKNSTKNFC